MQAFETFGRFVIQGADEAARVIGEVDTAAQETSNTVADSASSVEEFGATGSEAAASHEELSGAVDEGAGSVQDFTHATEDSRGGIGAMKDGLDGLSGVATALTGAIGGLGAKFASTGDDITDGAAAAGVGTEEFQELAYASEQMAGVSMQQLERRLPRIQQHLHEAQEAAQAAGGAWGEFAADAGAVSDSSQEALEQFERLGFSQEEIAEGAISSGDAYRRLLEEMRTARSEAEAVDLASDMLGRRMALQLAPQIHGAATSFDDYAARARDAGLIIDEEVIESGNRLHEAFIDMRWAMSAAAMMVGDELKPILIDFANWMIEDGVEHVKTFAGVIGTLVGWFESLPEPVRRSAVALAVVSSALKVIGTILGPLFKLGKLASLFKGLGVAAAVAKAPIALLVAGLVALAAVLIDALVDWEDFVERLEVLWDRFTERLEQSIDAAIEFMAELPGRAAEFAGEVIDWFTDIPGRVIDAFQDLVAGVRDLLADLVSAAVQRGREIANSIIEPFQRAYNTVVGNSIVPALANDTVDALAGMRDGASAVVGDMADGMAGSLGAVESPAMAGAGAGAGGTYIDMSRAVFRDTRDAEERMFRQGIEAV